MDRLIYIAPINSKESLCVVAVLCGREGNRRSAVAMALRHRLCGTTITTGLMA